MVSSFPFYYLLLSFRLFEPKTVVKPLNSKKNPGGKIMKKCEKCGEKCQKVWKSAETILPFSCCPFSFSLN